MVIKLWVYLTVFLVFSIAKADESSKYTLTEVAKHSSNQDCWMAIDNKVYDVSAYSPEHISKHNYDYRKFCGKDATTAWANKDEKQKPHKRKSTLLLQKYQIGSIN